MNFISKTSLNHYDSLFISLEISKKRIKFKFYFIENFSYFHMLIYLIKNNKSLNQTKENEK